MAIKLTCYFIISITVFFSKCSAVIVTVDDIVSVAEGNETRIICNMVKSNSGSIGIPIVTWNNVTNGVTDQIAQSQNGVGSVRSSYIDRFSVEGDTTLVIANTSRSDNGTYQCSVAIFDDPPSPASDDAILIVIYLDKPVLISFDTPVIKGDTVEMSCIANANPSPTYTFLRDGEVQQSEASSTFMIQSVSRDNNGSYVCRASNSAGTETSDSRTLDVQYLPECPCTDYKFANPGEKVTIAPKCVANPTDIDYQWSSVPNVTDLDSNEATFTFTVSKEFGTEYNITVIANNSIGSTTESVIVIVAIIENCTIIIDPNPAKEGESVHTECSSENSNPTPMITLFKDKNKIEYVNGTKLTFNIKSMKKSDEGDYYCIATNIAGSRTSDTIELTMKHTPNILAIILGSLGGCVVLVGSFVGHRVYKSNKSTKPSNDPTSDPVVPQDDVEMKQPDSNSDLKRYAASGGDLYTQVSLKDKKKKPDCDNGSNKPTAVDLNVEGLQYADLDLTRNLPTDKKNVIHHPDQETTYSSIQLQPQQI